MGTLKSLAHGAFAAGMALTFPPGWAQAATEDEGKCEPCRVTESFLIELPFIQEKGTFQAMVSSEYHSARGGRDVLAPISLEYGVSDSWQVGMDWLAWGSSRAAGEPDERGFGELGLTTKHSFAMKDPRNHLSAGFDLTILTGRLGGDAVGGRPSLLFGRDFPRCHNLNLFSEVAFDWRQKVRASDGGDDGSAAHEIFAGAGALIPLGNFCLSGEIAWSNNRWNHGGTMNELFLAPGVTWQISDAWQCGVAAPVGLNEGSDRFQVIGRVMFEF